MVVQVAIGLAAKQTIAQSSSGGDGHGCQGGAAGDIPPEMMGAIVKFAADLGLSNQDGVKTVSMYLFGRAMMEQLETPAS